MTKVVANAPNERKKNYKIKLSLSCDLSGLMTGRLHNGWEETLKMTARGTGERI